MTIKPEDLLTCVAAMTTGQRELLAQMLAPDETLYRQMAKLQLITGRQVNKIAGLKSIGLDFEHEQQAMLEEQEFVAAQHREAGGHLGPGGEVRLGPGEVPEPGAADRFAYQLRHLAAIAEKLNVPVPTVAEVEDKMAKLMLQAQLDNPPVTTPDDPPITKLRIIPAGGTAGLLASECHVSGDQGRTVNAERLFGPWSAGLDVLGQFTIRLLDVTAPSPIFKAFLDRYGDVCKARDNNIRLSCELGDLELWHCVVTDVGPVFGGGDMRIGTLELMACRIRRVEPSLPEGHVLGEPCEAADFGPNREPMAKLTIGGYEMESTESGVDPGWRVLDTSTLSDEDKKEILKNGWDDLGVHVAVHPTGPPGPEAGWMEKFGNPQGEAIKANVEEVHRVFFTHGPAEAAIVAEEVIPFKVLRPGPREEAGPGRMAKVPPDVPFAVSDAGLVDRWRHVEARWKALFGETLPITYTPSSFAADLGRVEEMLYDKEFRGREPARCCCGCRCVIGCGVP